MSSRAEVNSYLNEDPGSIRVTAEYVIAHAARQAQRGKAPSASYLQHTNPREALEAAVKAQERAEAVRTEDPSLRVLKSEYAIWGIGGRRMHQWGD